MSYIKADFNFEESFRFAMFQTKERQTLTHCHDCLEINFIERGTGHYVIEDKIYPIDEGDIFIINNSEHHIAVHGGELSMIVLVFDPKFVWENPEEYDYLKPFFHRGTSFSNRICKEADTYEEFCSYIKRISHEYETKNDGWQMIIKATLMLLLAMLYRYYLNNQELEEGSRAFQKSYDRIRLAVEYIHNNFHKKITLEELGEEAMMNKTYLSAYFSEVMNMRTFEYIEQVRINHACMLLKTTQLPITEIAFDSGFNGISYFNRTFKKVVGITPSSYRKESKDSASSS